MDFQEQLAKRLRHIERVSRGYDGGDVDQGVELAGPLAVIFHQTSKSTSLLRHLGRENIRLLSTCRRYPPKWRYWPIPNFTGCEMCPEINWMKSVPAYGNNGRRRFTPFSQWWNEVIFRRDFRKVRRSDLVYMARNHDGIGHVGNALDPRYLAMIDDLGMAISNTPDGEPPVTTRLRDGHASSLRQIAYEALNSPELLTLAPSFIPADEPPRVDVAGGWHAYQIRFGSPYSKSADAGSSSPRPS